MKRLSILPAVLFTGALAYAKVDLVTLPTRDTVQLTIYNSADLTLARESRALTVSQGENRLQFSWENTLIDPTSLEMTAQAKADQIEVSALTYPPRVKNLGMWAIQSRTSAKVPMEITYLTSGLSWRAFYMGTLSADEKSMDLQGYVRVTNNSGEDYENAQVRLIVGQIHLLDQIAELAQREQPYGRPGTEPIQPVSEPKALERSLRAKSMMMDASMAMAGAMPMKPKEIVKEGLSEYFLYTIEGTETIPNGWSKRLASFEARGVPVVNLYKFEKERYGDSVVRFLSFKNDKEHKLGQTPIPDGQIKVSRTVDGSGHLSYEGQSSFKYIPVGQEAELNLGEVTNVVVEPKCMDYKTDQHRFNEKRDLVGYDEVVTFTVSVRNTRDVPADVEIKRNFDTTYWDLDKQGEFGTFEKVDKDTVKFLLRLQARTVKTFDYTVRLYRGTRQEDWRK